MDVSSTQSASSSAKQLHRLADIVGTAIALLTLTLPMISIARFSDNSIESRMQPISFKLQNPEIELHSKA